MFCGISSFAHVDSGDRGGESSPSSAPSTPRGSRSRSKKEKRASENPYSSRGLDTFYAVLAELEAKRQRIVEKVGEKGSMVRFEYSDSQWVPIVVRIPTDAELAEEKKKKKTKCVVASKAAGDDQQRKDKTKLERRASSCSPPASGPMSPPLKSPLQQPIQHAPSTSTPEKKHLEPVAAVPSTAPAAVPPKADALRCWSRPRCRTAKVGPPCQGVRSLLLLAVILICLAVFGRTFAICCTCAWWYLAPSPTPTCMQGSYGGRWNKTTVDYGRRFSAKSLESVPKGGTFALPQNQRHSQGGFMSPPTQRQVNGLMSPPKQRLKGFLSPPKSRQAQGASPAKSRQSFNRRGGSLQLD